MEYAWIMAGGNQIQPEHLPHNIRNHTPVLPPRLSIAGGSRRAIGDIADASSAWRGSPDPAAHPSPLTPHPSPFATGRTLSEMEMDHILRVVEKHNGNKPPAAAELGISLKTLYNKLNKCSDEQSRAA